MTAPPSSKSLRSKTAPILAKWAGAVLVYLTFLAGSFLGIGAAYLALKAHFGRDPVGFPPLSFRVLAYWVSHPFEYVAVISATFAGVSTLWVTLVSYVRSWVRVVHVTGTIFLTGLLSCALCGMLWAYQDMRAGFFPAFDRMISHYHWGVVTGLMWGPAVILHAFPLNVVAFGLCYLMVGAVGFAWDRSCLGSRSKRRDGHDRGAR